MTSDQASGGLKHEDYHHLHSEQNPLQMTRPSQHEFISSSYWFVLVYHDGLNMGERIVNKIEGTSARFFSFFASRKECKQTSARAQSALPSVFKS